MLRGTFHFQLSLLGVEKYRLQLLFVCVGPGGGDCRPSFTTVRVYEYSHQVSVFLARTVEYAKYSSVLSRRLRHAECVSEGKS
eukprot:6184214-Pleurochrysis_carterae.AAC.1